jgi:antitoxin ParD1/3/4
VRSTQQFSVTLPNEMAQMVKAKVSSGEYASESEVIRDGLRALQARDKALDAWLRTEVAAAYDELKADPSKARTPKQVSASLRAETERQLKAR